MEAGFTITKQGWHLLAKLLAGDKLEISKIMVGSGKVPEGVNPGEITELVRPVALATSTVPQVEDKQVSFIVEYRSDLNGGLAEGFWLNEFGVYANDPDEGEVLLYYATMGDYPQYVAAYNGQAVDVRRYPVVIALSECYNVELKPPAGAWVTFEELIETLKRRGYHINPNLLINGDFRKPVNRNGKREYTGTGCTIDRWLVGGIEKATLQDGFITISVTDSNSAYESMAQALPGKQFNNKRLTASILYRSKAAASLAMYNLTQNLWEAGIDLPTSSAWNLVTLTKTFVEDDFGNDDAFGLNIYPSTIGQNLAGSIDIIAIKLELGNQQTLAHKDADGNWVLNDPPDYDLQYLLCSQYSPSTGEFVGSQHSNLNLLDNPDFAIWQRYPTGAYEGVPSNTFIPDRYQFIAASNVSTTLKRIDGGGIYCKSGSRCQILYKDENATTYAGKTMTLSCLSSKGLQTDTKIMPTNLSAETNLFGLFEHYLTWIYPEETKYRYKLELGPVQTLAHKDENGNWILNDPPPNKALELAKCQRLQQEIVGGDKQFGSVGLAFGQHQTTCYVNVPIGVPLRSNPAVRYRGVWRLVEETSLSNWVNGINISNITFERMTNNLVTLHLTTNSNLDPTKTYALCYASFTQTNSLLLDANL